MKTDRAGRTSLHYAAADDDVATINRLLAEGASPDVQDKRGFGPLHFAAQEYSFNSAKALLDASAQVDLENTFGNTPLFVAVFNYRGVDQGRLIELLRANDADPFHANTSGQSPLGLARLIANYDVARFFGDLPA